MTKTTDSSATVHEHALPLRLYFPQWQGAGVESIREFFAEVPFEQARRGYAVGAAVLNAVLPPTPPIRGSAPFGPTSFASPLSRFSSGSARRDARVWPSISMSMSWIATRSSSVLVRSLTA